MSSWPPNTPVPPQGPYWGPQTPRAVPVQTGLPFPLYQTPAQSDVAPHSPVCPTCGLSAATSTPAPAQSPEPTPPVKERRGPARSDKQKLFAIMASIKSAGFTLGEFLFHAFSGGAFSQKSAGNLPGALSYSQMVSAFLRGGTSHRVATILELWMKHPKGRPKPNSAEYDSMYSLVTPWKDLCHARPCLTSWAAQACRSRLEREARQVIKPENGLQAMISTPRAASSSPATRPLVRWSDIGETTVPEAQGVFQRVTPLLWGLLQQVTQKKRRHNHSIRGEYRPWPTVVTGAIGQLLFCRRRTVNVLPLQRSLTFFASHASTVVYRIESRFANTTSFNTLLAGLRTAGNERIATARALAGSAVSWIKLIFDNTQRFNRQHEMRAGRENTMHKGAAGYIVKMVGTLPTAWDLDEKLRLINLGLRYIVTGDDLLTLLDSAHIFTVRPLHWLQVLVDYIPELSHFSDEVARMFDELVSTTGAPPGPAEKTEIISLRCNASDLSFTAGISSAIDDFLGTQLGQSEGAWNRRSIIVGGDGATFEGVLRLKKQRQDHHTELERYENVDGEMELWHARWTESNRMFRAYIGPEDCNDPSTLRASMGIINRPIPPNLQKVEFQSSMDTLMLVGHARMLDCWRVILGAYDLLEYFRARKAAGTLPTLPELIVLATELDVIYASPRGHDYATQLREDQPPAYRVPEHPEWVRLTTNAQDGEPEDFGGDRVLANSIAFMYDFVTLREWSQATSSGSGGRVYEVLKSVLFNFAGSGHNPKYFGYVLETILDMEYECSDALKEAKLRNWLINPTGQQGHYVECDLVQEHLIKLLTVYSQRANAAYDGDFERNVLSPNLDNLVQLTRRMEAAVGLSPRPSKHTSMHTNPELRTLLNFYREHELHRFRTGHSFGYTAPLHFSTGVELMPAKLERYLAQHRAESDIFGRRWPIPASSEPLSQDVDDAVAATLDEHVPILDDEEPGGQPDAWLPEGDNDGALDLTSLLNDLGEAEEAENDPGDESDEDDDHEDAMDISDDWDD